MTPTNNLTYATTRSELASPLTIRRRQVWAASGLCFLAFTTAGLLVGNVFSSAPFPSPFGQPRVYALAGVPATDAVSYFTANQLGVQTVSFLDTIAALSLLVFVAFGAGLLADHAPERRSALPWVVVGTGSLAAGFWLLNALLLWILSRPETEQSGLIPVIQDLVYLCGGPAHVLTLGVFLAAVSAALWGQPVLPRWIAWTAGAAAVPSLLSDVTLLWEPATLLLPIGRGMALAWILAMSVSLLRGLGRSGEVLADVDRRADAEINQARLRMPSYEGHE